MFLLQGQPLSPDVAFTDVHGIQRPAGWLRLASVEEREAAGVSEVPDPPSYDQRFYWGFDQQGQLIPKDHAQLLAQWSDQTRVTAGTLIAPSDWMVVRQADNGVAVPDDVKAERERIRQLCGDKLAALAATSDTAELAAYVTGPDYNQWQPQVPPAGDVPLERARNADGTFIADDPATPSNEAWVISDQGTQG